MELSATGHCKHIPCGSADNLQSFLHANKKIRTHMFNLDFCLARVHEYSKGGKDNSLDGQYTAGGTTDN